MITGELKNKIDGIWDIFWSSGMTNPLTVIEQITYLMFIKILDDNELRNTNAAVAGGKLCNKWVSFWLSLLLGVFGAHKFYEGKPLMGILYLCTMGLAFVGVVIDLIAILAKRNPYYV